MLAAIVESSDDAIISKTLDGIISTWNNAAQRIFGYTADEAIGQSILMLLPRDRAHEEAAILAKLRNGERVDHFETIRLTKSGREINVSVTCSPIKDPAGQIIGASKIVRDITQRKQAEAAIQWQQAAMEHLGRLNTMGEMAAGLAHELNQPLTSILTYAGISLEAVRSDNASPQKLAPALQEVVNETRRAGEIIRRLRDYIRKREPVCEPVDINAMVMDSVHLLEHDLKQSGITLCLKLAQDIPLVLADSVQLVQVLVNLLRNARDAMLDPAAVGHTLTILSSASTREITVDVIDQGCGMTQDQMQRLFERFFSTKTSGLGMGLAISKTIVDSLGGRLTGAVNSGIGGMTFRLTLPNQREQ